MRKLTLPALATVAVVASLSLPAIAAADPFRHGETRGMHVEPLRNTNVYPVHDERRYAPIQYEPRYYRHDHGRHYGHRRPDVYRYDYRPVERREYRYDYRPVEVYPPRINDDIRVRISYDLHL